MASPEHKDLIVFHTTKTTIQPSWTRSHLPAVQITSDPHAAPVVPFLPLRAGVYLLFGGLVLFVLEVVQVSDSRCAEITEEEREREISSYIERVT
jgi:hypothetical protein